ncbi:uncharacterized protein LOC132558772 [Ylistrum balloti]|uniref:uncharacterized protein LOC132558772 n=1 Tax=Ylistrum balloti TaxID=509963 RepID=UPI002905CB97|nr:uncharacterized protein LOC132558772 [Ylistrum balloti]
MADVDGHKIIYCESDGTFKRISGHKLSGANLILKYQFSNPIIACAVECFQTECLSINYHSETKECQLCKDSPYTNPVLVQEAQYWEIYYLQKENDWELVFRAQAYNNISPYNAWMGTLSLPTLVEEGCLLLMNTSTCTTIYRNDILNTWDSESISEVKLELYKAGVRVVNIRFNGTRSTYTDWFGINRLIDSGWETLSQSRHFPNFSVRGPCQRSFYINQYFRGCRYDKGLILVNDLNYNPCPCTYDTTSNRPEFMYAPGEDVTQWEDYNYGQADVLAVFIKR